jgi:anti-anti-sigma regulatory factor
MLAFSCTIPPLNGDEAGAEAALQAMLAPGVQATAQNGVWLALFDLYRATGRRSRFDALAMDYAVRVVDAAPSWAAEPAPDELPEPSTASHWASPEALTLAQVLQLQSLALPSEPCVLVLDWSAVAIIDDAAVAPLATLFTQWADQRLSLHVHAAPRLDELLSGHTISGTRGAPSDWWMLRMAWLRLTHRPDAHELVALDYCITYEVSPPDWRDVTCACVSMTGAGAREGALQVLPGGDADARDAAIMPAITGALSGVITGDAGALLNTFTGRAEGAGPQVIDCAQLVRIDFAAAGSVLNWAVMQQSAGRQVQFIGLHRLVATFFSVIGMGEYAAIFLRRH